MNQKSKEYYVRAPFAYITVDIPTLFLRLSKKSLFLTKSKIPGVMIITSKETSYQKDNLEIEMEDELLIPYYFYEYMRPEKEDELILSIADDSDEVKYLLAGCEADLRNAEVWMGASNYTHFGLKVRKVGIQIPEELEELKNHAVEVVRGDVSLDLLIKDLVPGEIGDDNIEIKVEDLYQIRHKLNWRALTITVTYTEENLWLSIGENE